MRQVWVPFLIAMLLLPGLSRAGDPDGLQTAEARLAARLEQDRTQCAKVWAVSVPAPAYGPFAKAMCAAEKNLRRLVAKTSREALPEVLVGLFIDELTGRGPREVYPPLEDYVVIFGAPAVAPLMARYGEVPQDKREAVLRAFGEIGSEAPLPLVRAEAKHFDPATLSLAAYALRKIRKEAAREELLPLLRDPRVDAQAVTTIAQQLMFLEDPGWYDIVLDQAAVGRIPFETVTRLTSFDRYPEAAVAGHLDYLLQRWAAGDHRTVACLLYQVHDHAAVKRWSPVYQDLLRDKYGYGEKFFSLMSADCPPFRHARKHPLLDRVENTLAREDVEAWLREPLSGWASYLHLRELYHRKGGPPLEVEDLSFEMAFSAYDETHNVLLGECRDRFRNGVAREVELPSGLPDGKTIPAHPDPAAAEGRHPREALDDSHPAVDGRGADRMRLLTVYDSPGIEGIVQIRGGRARHPLADPARRSSARSVIPALSLPCVQFICKRGAVFD